MIGMGNHSRLPEGWTLGQATLAVGLLALGAAITVPAFVVLYLTVTHLVYPWLGDWSWTVPASGEIAFTGIWLTGVLLAWRGEPGGAIRPVLLALFAAGSLYLNVYAAHGSAPDAVAHILVVAAFFGYLVVGKSAIGKLRAARGRPDRLSAAEWMLHPYRSASLRSRMALWGETSKARAQRRHSVLLYAIALTQADSRIGKFPFAWRRHLPVTLRYQLGAGEFPAPVEAVLTGRQPWQEAVRTWVNDELAFLDKAPAEGIPEGSGEGTREGIPQGTREGSGEGTSQGTRQGSPRAAEWPESRTVPRAVLVQRTRAAMRRWEDRHQGKPLPATQLGAQLKLRMSRDTATALLSEARAPGLHLAAKS